MWVGFEMSAIPPSRFSRMARIMRHERHTSSVDGCCDIGLSHFGAFDPLLLCNIVHKIKLQTACECLRILPIHHGTHTPLAARFQWITAANAGTAD